MEMPDILRVRARVRTRFTIWGKLLGYFRKVRTSHKPDDDLLPKLFQEVKHFFGDFLLATSDLLRLRLHQSTHLPGRGEGPIDIKQDKLLDGSVSESGHSDGDSEDVVQRPSRR